MSFTTIGQLLATVLFWYERLFSFSSVCLYVSDLPNSTRTVLVLHYEYKYPVLFKYRSSTVRKIDLSTVPSTILSNEYTVPYRYCTCAGNMYENRTVQARG